jgi:hypothetical protein
MYHDRKKKMEHFLWQKTAENEGVFLKGVIFGSQNDRK